MNYKQTIAENMAHMGTAPGEWRPVPIKGFQDTPGPNGQMVSMPVFDFPKGYDRAPSLYAGMQNTCELCCHEIQNYFWAQNDSKKWIMAVGSECYQNLEFGFSGVEWAASEKKRIKDEKKAAEKKRAREIRKMQEFFDGLWLTKEGRQKVWEAVKREDVKTLEEIKADIEAGPTSTYVEEFEKKIHISLPFPFDLEIFGVVEDRPKAYQLKRSNTSYTCWIPKTALKPVTHGTDDYVLWFEIRHWFIKKLDISQRTALGMMG